MKNRTKGLLILSLFAVLAVLWVITLTQIHAYFDVERLEITGLPDTGEYGQQIQLTAVGYYADGRTVPPEVMQLLGLRWVSFPEIHKSDIDRDGLLTVTSEYDCNVQVYSRWLDVSSRPVTVRVSAAD